VKKIIKILVILFWIYPSFSADKITLEQCYQLAEKNYPVARQIEEQQLVSDLKIKNLNAKYYPDLNLFGQATYQSDVTRIDLTPFPAIKIPFLTKDQYRVGFNVDQLIWDGGAIGDSKALESVQSDASQKSVEVELYNLRQRINEAYFNVILMRKKQEQLDITKADLVDKLTTIRIKVYNGVMLGSNADILDVEIQKIEQSTQEVQAGIKTSVFALEQLINANISDSTFFELPAPEFEEIKDTMQLRKEYQLFSLNKSSLDAMQELNSSKYYPKIAAFGQYMYGKPGFNMFNPDFQTFYIVGLRASWDIWDWNSTNRENEILNIQKDILNSQEDVFSLNLSIAMKNYLNEINKLNNLIEKDKQIIMLRQKIVGQASSQLDNGIITATEYVADVNAESQARLALEVHNVELIRAKVNYLTQAGKM
jgi:outer membrane protein TolC